MSESFGVANGVRQGGVLSPILFTVYIDELLHRLSSSGVGCHVGGHFVGSVGYADDIALIAPSPSALRILMKECESFAHDFGLVFNADKTQLICFSSDDQSMVSNSNAFCFLGRSLSFSTSITHLGHILTANLDDTEDVKRVSQDMCRKANFLLQTFSSCDPLVKTKLITTHCLALYGATLWNIGCKQIKSLDVALNNILRRIWRLPRQCHTRILHVVADSPSVFNRIAKRYTSFACSSCNASSQLVRSIFCMLKYLGHTPIGYNHMYCKNYEKMYSNDDYLCGDFVRSIRLKELIISGQSPIDTENIIYSVCCD